MPPKTIIVTILQMAFVEMRRIGEKSFDCKTLIGEKNRGAINSYLLCLALWSACVLNFTRSGTENVALEKTDCTTNKHHEFKLGMSYPKFNDSNCGRTGIFAEQRKEFLYLIFGEKLEAKKCKKVHKNNKKKCHFHLSHFSLNPIRNDADATINALQKQKKKIVINM